MYDILPNFTLLLPTHVTACLTKTEKCESTLSSRPFYQFGCEVMKLQEKNTWFLTNIFRLSRSNHKFGMGVSNTAIVKATEYETIVFFVFKLFRKRRILLLPHTEKKWTINLQMLQRIFLQRINDKVIHKEKIGIRDFNCEFQERK